MHIFHQNIVIENTFVAFLDGKKCTELAHFFKEIAKAFNFPDYFQPNFDALDECITDLSWIEEKEVHLMIFNYSNFLCEEPYGKKIVNNIFANAIDELKEKEITFSIFIQQS